MESLQELITRGRFILAGAQSRLQVFEAVNGRKSLKEIASILKRHENNVRRDLNVLRDAGLVQLVENGARPGVYEKVPLARTIPLKYFKPTGARPTVVKVGPRTRSARNASKPHLSLPSEQDVLDIAKNGEDQLHEFKSPGTMANKLVREVAAMLNTEGGGLIFYGIDDNGVILGSDVPRQVLDQPLHNAMRGISPAATVSLREVDVLGSTVLVIIVPPWNRRDVYQFEDRYLVRKGTNVMALRPEELRAMHEGRAVV